MVIPWKYGREDILRGLLARLDEEGSSLPEGEGCLEEIYRVPGMVDRRIRRFVRALSWRAVYGEVGTLLGATALAASWRQEGRYYSVDNLSQWPTLEELQGQLPILVPRLPVEACGSRRDYIERLLERFGQPFTFVETDGNRTDWAFLEGRKLDVFYYDAEHTQEGTCQGLLNAMPHWADQVVVLVDDWYHEPVQQGAEQALAQWPGKRVWDTYQDWWNGFYVAYLERT